MILSNTISLTNVSMVPGENNNLFFFLRGKQITILKERNISYGSNKKFSNELFYPFTQSIGCKTELEFVHLAFIMEVSFCCLFSFEAGFHWVIQARLDGKFENGITSFPGPEIVYNKFSISNRFFFQSKQRL